MWIIFEICKSLREARGREVKTTSTLQPPPSTTHNPPPPTFLERLKKTLDKPYLNLSSNY